MVVLSIIYSAKKTFVQRTRPKRLLHFLVPSSNAVSSNDFAVDLTRTRSKAFQLRPFHPHICNSAFLGARAATRNKKKTWVFNDGKSISSTKKNVFTQPVALSLPGWQNGVRSLCACLRTCQLVPQARQLPTRQCRVNNPNTTFAIASSNYCTSQSSGPRLATTAKALLL